MQPNNIIKNGGARRASMNVGAAARLNIEDSPVQD
jgi:hypothetical protein